jgi:acyl carrier protein
MNQGEKHMHDIQEALKRFILDQFLPGERAEALTGQTPLLESAIIDSVGLIQFVAFIEERFHVAVEAHEINDENFATLADVGALVARKLGDGTTRG